ASRTNGPESLTGIELLIAEVAFYYPRACQFLATPSAPPSLASPFLSRGFTRDNKSTPIKTRVETPDQTLAILKENPNMTLAEIPEQSGKSLSAVERASANLGKAGRLRHIGLPRTVIWRSFPRTTDG